MTRQCSLVVAGSPAQLTGGYLYDARIVKGLGELGWQVETHGLAGRFPQPDATARVAFDECLSVQPDGACVIVDGLVFGGLPEVAQRHADRLALIALVHHPLAEETGLDPGERAHFRTSERAALRTARRIIVTSAFTARALLGYAVPPERIRVVEPGVDPSPLAPADHEPPRLLCVASITPRKGHAVLVEALASLRALPWSCTLVGSAMRDPAHAATVLSSIASCGLTARIRVEGELEPAALEAYWREADLFVLPSYFEGYGMVITEAIAHGVPVLTTSGGALADTLPAGAGRCVPPGDVPAFTAALSALLQDAGARRTLRDGARRARTQLRDWRCAAQAFAAALDGLAA